MKTVTRSEFVEQEIVKESAEWRQRSCQREQSTAEFTQGEREERKRIQTEYTEVIRNTHKAHSPSPFPADASASTQASREEQATSSKREAELIRGWSSKGAWPHPFHVHFLQLLHLFVQQFLLSFRLLPQFLLLVP